MSRVTAINTKLMPTLRHLHAHHSVKMTSEVKQPA